MDERLAARAAEQGGVFLRQQALDIGYDDAEIARQKAVGAWRTVRRGAYMDATLWAQLDDVGRHRARVYAAVRQLDVPVVVSHISAAVMLGLNVWDVDLSYVHLTRRDAHSSRREAGVTHHRCTLDESEIVTVDGLQVTSPARTAVDVARCHEFERAVVVADSALRLPGVGPDDLHAALEVVRDWPGARAAGRAVAFADGRSESVGESRHRVQIRRIGLPPPELQVVVVIDGREYRLDFVFEDVLTAGEFDGRGKYDRLLAPGETAAQAVWREKVREDRIRGAGFEVVRPVWADLSEDRSVARRYRDAFERGRRRLRSAS